MGRKWLWSSRAMSVCLFSTCLILVGVGVLFSEDKTSQPKPKSPAKKSGIQVIYPPKNAVLRSGNFRLICKAKDLKLEVDGKPEKWGPFESPLHVAHLHLPPGMHHLQIGKEKREICVELNDEEHDGPADWLKYHCHPMQSVKNSCDACHKTERHKNKIYVGKLKSHKACLECHTTIDFEVIHAHVLEPFESCEMCHSLHGSTRKSLLKAPMRKLCEECHDPDH